MEEEKVTTNEPTLADLQAQIEELTKKNDELTKQSVEREKYIGNVKKAMDKSLSETAQYKRDLRAKQTEEEAKAAEVEEAIRKRDEEFADLKLSLEKLEGEKRIAEDTKKFMSLGLDDKVADKCAKARSNGNLDEVLTCIKAHYEAKMNEQKQNWINTRPDPMVGGESKEEDPFLKGFDM